MKGYPLYCRHSLLPYRSVKKGSALIASNVFFPKKVKIEKEKKIQCKGLSHQNFHPMVYHIFSVNEPRGNCIWIVFETVPSKIRRKFNLQKLYTITSRPQRSPTHDLRAFGVKSVSTGRGCECMCMCRTFPVNERIGIAKTQVGNLNFR